MTPNQRAWRMKELGDENDTLRARVAELEAALREMMAATRPILGKWHRGRLKCCADDVQYTLVDLDGAWKDGRDLLHPEPPVSVTKHGDPIPTGEDGACAAYFASAPKGPRPSEPRPGTCAACAGMGCDACSGTSAYPVFGPNAYDERQRPETALPVYPGPLSMSKDEVLERLCDVLHKVWESFDPNAHEPNDCFCLKANSTLRFQTSAQALRWVESLVSDALRRRAMVTGSEGAGPGKVGP